MSPAKKLKGIYLRGNIYWFSHGTGKERLETSLETSDHGQPGKAFDSARIAALRIDKCLDAKHQKTGGIIIASRLPAAIPGDMVLRWLAGCDAAMPLLVTEVTAERIICQGGWQFDRHTGVEIDEGLGWRPTSLRYLL